MELAREFNTNDDLRRMELVQSLNDICLVMFDFTHVHSCYMHQTDPDCNRLTVWPISFLWARSINDCAAYEASVCVTLWETDPTLPLD